MIGGVGIDIIEVARVKEKIEKNMGFREKVFSAREVDYCESTPATKYQHYAARFAAKEAFLKASGKGLLLSHDLNQIEIETNTDGKPIILISDQIKKSMALGAFHIHVSLSHLESTACAVVILESN